MIHFDPNATYILEDERVLLRPLCVEDLPLLRPCALHEPELWKFSLQYAFGMENMIAYIASAIEARTNGNAYPFIVFDKQQQQYAGTTRFYDIQPYHKSLQLGYTWYGKAFQGTGLNTHCKFLLLQHAFEVLGIDRVEFRADATNKKSIAAMKKIGCTVEGVLRSHYIKPDGTRRDSIVLSILAEEWNNGIDFLNKQLK
jgi:RimJ/RimL family protein N-acetyltransferase